MSSLNNYVAARIYHRPRHLTLREIADEAGVPLHWLETYARGGASRPAVQHIEALYIYFTGAPLALPALCLENLPALDA